MVDLLGWLGALLVLASCAQRQTLRLRQLNLMAGGVLLAYNLAIGIWPAVAMETALALVNGCRLYQLTRPQPAPDSSLGAGSGSGG